MLGIQIDNSKDFDRNLQFMFAVYKVLSHNVLQVKPTETSEDLRRGASH